MKNLFFFLGLVCPVAMLLPACAPAPEPESEPAPEPVFDQAVEEAAVRAIVRQGFDTWNQHDPQAHLDVYVDDYENWAGTLKGRTAREKSYLETWSRQEDSQHVLLDEIGVIFVTPDVAIFKAIAENTGFLDEEGKPLPPLKWMGAWVLSKNDGKWLVSAIFSRPIEQ
jgi:uncharacterized protein (TIGR02246 family)